MTPTLITNQERKIAISFTDWKATVKQLIGKDNWFKIPDDNQLVKWYEKGLSPRTAMERIEWFEHYDFEYPDY